MGRRSYYVEVDGGGTDESAWNWPAVELTAGGMNDPPPTIMSSIDLPDQLVQLASLSRAR